MTQQCTNLITKLKKRCRLEQSRNFRYFLKKLSNFWKVLPGSSASTKLMTQQKVNTRPNKGHNFISGGLVIIKQELRLKWNGNKGYDKA